MQYYANFYNQFFHSAMYCKHFAMLMIRDEHHLQ